MPRVLLLSLLLALLCSCASDSPPTKLPVFRVQAVAPVAVYVEDQRPIHERAAGHSKSYLYSASNSQRLLLGLGQDTGNILMNLKAIRQFRLVSDPEDISDHELLLHLEVRSWFARLPVSGKGDKKSVPVEGACKVRVRLSKAGKALYTKTFHAVPPPLGLPVRMIRQNNVNQVVPAAFQEQLRNAENALFDQMMLHLSSRWESLLGVNLPHGL